MTDIPGFEGSLYSREGDESEKQDYKYYNQQYASSSYNKETAAVDSFYDQAAYGPGDRDLHPHTILVPKDDKDVQAAVRWATDKKIAIAIKSGGHQYSGASSTYGDNVQLDLSHTYKEMKIVKPEVPGSVAEDRALVKVGVSVQLQDFNAYLASHGLFVPHGQCAYVCVGGHGQTGGYGQLGRSFGLFGDNIRVIRMVDHCTDIKEVTDENDPELFRAILGGSPGNFGVITHYIVEVYRGKSYMGEVPYKSVVGKEFKGPHGLKMLCVYSKETLRNLLNIVARMSDDNSTARGFDLCISAVSMDFPIAQLFPALKQADRWKEVTKKIEDNLSQEANNYLNGRLPAMLLVYAQWAPTSPGESYDVKVDDWFNKFRAMAAAQGFLTLQMEEYDESLATLSGKWIFPRKREFDLPYVKRTWATNSTTLVSDGWADEVADRVDLIYNSDATGEEDGEDKKRYFKHCKLALQIQPFGGENSRFYCNRTNGTSYSWRDSTVVQVLDCFYEDTYRDAAVKWQTINDTKFVGPNSKFSKQDRRLLWGSYGNWNMDDKDEIWKFYYENAEKYVKLGKARLKADPNRTFTPNPFSVTRYGEKPTGI